MKSMKLLMIAVVLGFMQAIVACSSGSDYGAEQHNHAEWVLQSVDSHWGGDGCNFGC